jgi:adenosine 3'-phospho 5'-phosphosulfate transporter B2
MVDGPGLGRGYFLPLAIKTISLIAVYATYGVLQERIIKGHYSNLKNVILDGEPPNDTFTSAPFLVLCNRLVSLTTGIVLAQIQWARSNYSPLPSNTSNSFRSKTWCSSLSEQMSRIRPASSFLSYAIVAGLNNAATLSQYSSLAYLSFTTSTLGKSAKMVPVLILGHMWYGKRYKTRQWIGAAIVILGIWGYLTSLLSIDMNRKQQEIVPTSNLIGIACLFAYLFFDGMTSTMQERLFGQAKGGEETSSLMGITSGIIDQMVHAPSPSPPAQH